MKSIDFTNEESTFDDISKLKSFYNSFDKALKEFDQTEDKIYSTIHKQKYYGNKLKDRFHWLLRKEKNANIICIYLSPKILEANAKEYYPIIKILGDNIKEHLI